MVKYQGNQLLIFSSCITLTVGFVVGLFLFGVCLLFLFIKDNLAWWHILVSVLGMLMGFYYLVINLMAWYKKVKGIPLAYCDGERIVRMHLGSWEVPLAQVESIQLIEVGRSKYIAIYCNEDKPKALVESSFFVGDMTGVAQALADHVATYRPARD